MPSTGDYSTLQKKTQRVPAFPISNVCAMGTAGMVNVWGRGTSAMVVKSKKFVRMGTAGTADVGWEIEKFQTSAIGP